MNESKLITVNVSHGFKFQSQRGNASDSDCNIASHLMGLRYMGYENRIIPTHERDNAVMYFLNLIDSDPLVQKLYNSSYIEYKKLGFEPHQVHNLFAIGLNKVMGIENFVRFSTNTKLTNMLFDNLCGLPYVTTGTFTSSGHIVCGVGFTTTQQNILDITQPELIDVTKIESIIIDDPYGDWNLRYRGDPALYMNGDDTYISLDEFNKVVRNTGNLEKKWAYRYGVKSLISNKH